MSGQNMLAYAQTPRRFVALRSMYSHLLLGFFKFQAVLISVFIASMDSLASLWLILLLVSGPWWGAVGQILAASAAALLLDSMRTEDVV